MQRKANMPILLMDHEFVQKSHGCYTGSQFIMTGSQGYRQLEQLVPSGYITPTIRRWRLNSAAAQMAFCVLYSPASPAQGMVLLTVKMSIPISIDIINMNPHRHAPRPISQVILNSVKLTINTSSHNNQIHNAFIFSW